MKQLHETEAPRIKKRSEITNPNPARYKFNPNLGVIAIPNPEGISENSPAFQRRGLMRNATSPEGAAETL